MRSRSVVASEPAVSAVGLGCVGLTSEYLDPDWDNAEASVVLERALELGVTLFDTADSYGPFRNELLLGSVLGARADEVVISSKVGLVHDEEHQTVTIRATPEHIARSCRESLARLGVERIGLYYLHRPDPAVPVEESWGAMRVLVEEGLVGALGACEVGADVLDRLHAIHPVASVQSELSLWTRTALPEVLPWTRAHGASFVAYAPLGRGYLTGRITSADFLADDIRASNPRFTDEAIRRNRVIVATIEDVARSVGATASQVAIAWILGLGPDVLAIPGTKRTAYLEENCAAAELELDDAHRARLDALPEPFGARY
jgi:aryl-alcohol dehydrogenase-like predicted oxidoreductase